MATYTEKLEGLYVSLQMAIYKTVNKIGVDTKNGSNRIRIKRDDLMFNIEGSHNNDYVIEVGEYHLFSAQGLTYNFNCLPMEQLCELVDYIKTLK
jgi:hypothetical protein